MNNFEIELDKSSKVKLYHQLYRFFESKIKSGELPLGTKLPSIRKLSDDYSISRNTVTKAYGELEKDGYIYSLSKSGYFIKNPEEQYPVPAVTSEEQDTEIPTVDSLLRNSSPSLSIESDKSSLVLTNTDALNDVPQSETMILKNSLSNDEISSGNEDSGSITKGKQKENSLLMNSGDIVNSESSKGRILSPLAAFIDSCITALAEHHNRLSIDSKADIQGESPLRVSIAAFIYKFHNMDINPAQIVLGSNLSYTLFNLLQLKEFLHPAKSMHGLLQLAENSISQETITPVVAISDDIEENIVSAITAAGFKTEIINQSSIQKEIETLNRIKATIIISTTSSIRRKNLSTEEIQLVYSWLNEKEYRYFIEIDNIPEPHNYEKTQNYTIKDRWIYMNSFAYLISKSINSSFMFLPKQIIESYKEKYKNFGSPLSMIDQCGLIDFLIKGKLYNYLTNLEDL